MCVMPVTVRTEHNLVLSLLSLHDDMNTTLQENNDGNMKLRGMYCRYAVLSPYTQYGCVSYGGITSQTEADSGGG